MEVGHRQEVCQTRSEPASSGQRLALRTVAIATGVVRDALVTARVTLVHMTAEHTGAADFDGPHYPVLLWRQRLDAAEVGPVPAEDVGQLERWPGHQNSGSATG